jgi:predicted SnoaL-like aldol condensation-catalyzing enzyme
MHPRPILTMLLALTVVGMLPGSTLTARSQEATPSADLEANKALARRFHDDIFERGNLGAADEILAPTFTWYIPPTETFLTGPEAIKQQAKDLKAFFPDLTISNDDVIAEGDRVVIRWTLRGTAQTETGPVPVRFTGIDIFRIENGKLAELWQLIDNVGLQAQLDAAATPAATPTG